MTITCDCGLKRSAPDCPCGLASSGKTDPVNPAHYQGDYVMRVIEDFKLDFLDGQVVKYILRAGKKEGQPLIQEYEKALWYLNRKIANLKTGSAA